MIFLLLSFYRRFDDRQRLRHSSRLMFIKHRLHKIFEMKITYCQKMLNLKFPKFLIQIVIYSFVLYSQSSIGNSYTVY